MNPISRLLTPLRNLAALRNFTAGLLTEGLAPGPAARAVFLGIFIAQVPIYGFQAVTAIALAVYFGLNKPLTLAATFINNPLLQPFLVALSVMAGHFLLTGHFQHFFIPEMTMKTLRQGLAEFVTGSIALGFVLGGLGALITYAIVVVKQPADPRERQRAQFVNRLFAHCASADRGFVRWKIRLDRIFGILSGVLAAGEPDAGAAVDLGCGHGTALGFAAFGRPDRAIYGCDLDRGRIAAAQQAFAPLNASFQVADVRNFQIPRAGLILILDVLQYLSREEQRALVLRCCAALEPRGKFILRVHDRQRGIFSKLSLGFDRIIFRVGGAPNKPLMLTASDYREALHSAGMQIEEIRFRNRLPLAHLVFISTKPEDAG